MKTMQLNDRERAQWIDNYEPLYLWWKQSHKSKARFIKEHRAEITAVIERQLGICEPTPFQ